MTKYSLIVFLFIAFIACQKEEVLTNSVADDQQKLIVNAENPSIKLQKIAFGSCNKQDLPQDIWSSINVHQPDLWIWLGDNIYGDTEDMSVLQKKYALQKSNSGYQQLLNTTPIIGIWDDHDYGVNDGGIEYPKKQESKKLMMEFLDVPKDNPVWGHEGAYNSYSFGDIHQKLKVILLDARYFRENLLSSESEGKRYELNATGNILGEEQWLWLENQLENSDAQLHILACGIQMIPSEHAFEKWANFPQARQRLFELLQKHPQKRIILLSGDRHMAEISRMELEGTNNFLYEITASGLTHSWATLYEESNQYRIGDIIAVKNFALMEIEWRDSIPEVNIQIRGVENQLLSEVEISYQ